MKKKFAPLSKLTISSEQPLLFPVFNKQGTLLAKKGTLLTRNQVKKIRTIEQIYTYEHALKSALVNNETNDESASIFKLPPPLKRFTALEKILHEVYKKPDDSINQSKILTMISRLQTICEKSPDAAIAKIITDDNSDYAVKHAIHTAILCELSAQYLKWSVEDKRNIVGAALTMNISLGYMQNKLLDQPQPLSLEQQKTIHEHPKKSVVMLQKMGMTNKAWLSLVEKHHENTDGSGYPNGLKQREIPIAASLISLSDTYCAKVTGRNYRAPIFANVAARDIYLEKDQAHEGTLIEIFVKLLGLYPPGCSVKLKSGEVGIVIKRGDRVDTPHVMVLRDPKNVSNLLKVKRQTSQKSYSIESIVEIDMETFKLDLNEIWPV